jgi:hypothetical protein
LEEFLDSLNAKQAQKVLWVLKAVQELPRVPKQYFKQLEGTDNLWEVRAEFGGDAFRLLGCREIDHSDEWIREANAKDTGTRNRAGRATQARLPEPEKT